MKNRYDYLPNGYQETIEKGLNALHVFSRNPTASVQEKNN